MGLDHLWAGWRRAYIESLGAGGDRGDDEEPDADRVDDGDLSHGSLFERVLAMPDAEAYVVHRGVACAAVLNAYPYTNGHILVMPVRRVAHLEDMADPEHDELWRLVRDAVSAIRAAYRCDGVNVGLNLGEAAGAGVPDHIHVHVLPRWHGDTNFMTSVAEARVMPETLSVTWEKLRKAWPSSH